MNNIVTEIKAIPPTSSLRQGPPGLTLYIDSPVLLHSGTQFYKHNGSFGSIPAQNRQLTEFIKSV